MTSPPLIDVLQECLRREHAVIVQSLLRAWQFDEDEIGCELEEISREDMRHFRWLGTLIARLGGRPTMERGVVARAAGSRADRLRVDLETKQLEVERYGGLVERIDEPNAKHVLARILADEEAHVTAIEEMIAATAAKTELEPTDDSSGSTVDPDPNRERLIEILNQDADFEYTTILQYLHQSFIVNDLAISRTLEEDQAQESMKHLGWLAERISEIGGDPRLASGEIDTTTTDVQGILEIGAELEAEAIRIYGEHLAEIDDPESHKIIERIHNQEVFHKREFEGLVEGEPARDALPAPLPTATDQSEPPRLTIGSLFGQRQE